MTSRSEVVPIISQAMTPTPSSEQTTDTPTTTVSISPTDFAASSLSRPIPRKVTITESSMTRSEMCRRSDHWMPAMARSPRIVITLCHPLASGALLGAAFPRRSSLAPQSRRRRAPPARSCRFRLVSVPDAPDRDDAPGHGRVGLELLAQPPHMHGDGRRVTERPAPHLGEQLLPGEGLARVPHQEDEQVILPRGQLDQLAVGPDFVRGQVHDQVAVGDGAEIELVGQAGTTGPAQHR